MVNLLKLGLLAVGLCLCATARSTTDCQRTEQRKVAGTTQRVIVYRDPAVAGFAAADLREIEREVQDTVLLNYMDSLGAKSASVSKLEFLICDGPRTGTTLTKTRDVKDFMDFGVTLAMWRSREKGKDSLSHAVIPHLNRNIEVQSIDQEVVVLDSADATDPLRSWVARIQANNAALSSLLGLGLGLKYLDKGEGFVAKLALCKSRQDLQRSFSSLLRPQRPAKELTDTLDKLIHEADQQIGVSAVRPDDDLLKRIKSACAPSPGG